MLFRIDLKIFIFLILFYFTRQIEIYTMMFIFAFVHELGHLLTGIFMGMKPEKLEFTPYGVGVSFKINPKDYNIKIMKGNILELKKILVAMAGPLINAIIAFIFNASQIITYANILLIIFNLIPIYPLDGGRILKGILHICLGKRKAEKCIRNIGFVTLIIITLIASIGILYFENISIFIITIFLWFLYIRQEKIENARNKIYDLIEKTIEIE